MTHRQNIILMLIILIMVELLAFAYVAWIAPDPVKYCNQFELSEYQKQNDLADDILIDLDTRLLDTYRRLDDEILEGK